MSAFHIVAIIMSLTALGAYLNRRFIKFPPTIGAMAFAFVLSVLAIALDEMGLVNIRMASLFVEQIDFAEILLHGMLAYLLFAGALHINLIDLRTVKWSVGLLATLGVIIATFVTGSLIWLAANAVGLSLPYLYALLFGALISPTDPIAVLSILKEVGISKRLYTKIGGESLFNDGVSIVAFLTILDLATGAQPLDATRISLLLLQETVGGAALGLLLGWAAYRLIRSIDDYKVEVMLTLALVTGGYTLAELLHVSGPIYMVTAGLIVGNHGRNFGMSEKTRVRLDNFWELLDEVLNTVLFMLIGLEIIVVNISPAPIALGLLAILAVFAGRIISVCVPAVIMAPRAPFEWKTVGLLTWGGLRGGMSIAMALSLPAGPQKELILTITYIVVLFSILGQGLTFKSSLKYLLRKKGLENKTPVPRTPVNR